MKVPVETESSFYVCMIYIYVEVKRGAVENSAALLLCDPQLRELQSNSLLW